jgi:transposase
MTGDGPYRHEAGLRWLGASGAGTVERDPHSGQLFVFRGRRGGLIKILWHDGQGLCLFAKRLERGRFIWPSASGDAVTITAAQLGYLSPGRNVLS